MASAADAQESPNSRHNTSLSRRVHQNASCLFYGMTSKYLEGETKGKFVDYLRESLHVNSNCTDKGGGCSAVFKVMAQSVSGPPNEEMRLGHEKLEQYIRDYVSSRKNRQLSFCALIAENRCPYSTCLLRTELQVKPGFWATHFEKSYLSQLEDVDP
ncbi:hypothetical protein DL771_003490 [Monosporascus sp. 5C6A]|nr:hypothetical protein DL771_003490 [Monosporascus sp. 5C6A]